jgi:hypothetical protein
VQFESKFNGVQSVEKESQQDDIPTGYILIAPLNRVSGATNTAIAFEYFVTRAFAPGTKCDHMIPKGKDLTSAPFLFQKVTESIDLSALSGSIDSRKTDCDHARHPAMIRKARL